MPSSSDAAELNRDPSPENVAKFDAYFGQGTSQKVLGTGKRSDVPMGDGGDAMAPQPSTTVPGTAIQRVAGQGLQLPEGVGEAMGQAVDAESMPEFAPNERPEQNLGGKGRRAVEQAAQIDANKKQNTLMEKQVESALMVKDYVPSINRAVRMWDELKKRGSDIQSDLPLINTGPGAAVLRGARGLANKVGVGGAMPDLVRSQEFAQPFREAMAHLELLRAQAIKGQGQITEGERAILRRSLPSLDTSNPAETSSSCASSPNVLTTIYKRGALASRRPATTRERTTPWPASRSGLASSSQRSAGARAADHGAALPEQDRPAPAVQPQDRQLRATARRRLGDVNSSRPRKGGLD